MNTLEGVKVFGTGAVGKWLERLDYDAESPEGRGWASSSDDWKTLSVNPAVNECLFSN